eukprot:542297-Hanusia_phi.AAC.4
MEVSGGMCSSTERGGPSRRSRKFELTSSIIRAVTVTSATSAGVMVALAGMAFALQGEISIFFNPPSLFSSWAGAYNGSLSITCTPFHLPCSNDEIGHSGLLQESFACSLLRPSAHRVRRYRLSVLPVAGY